MIRSFSTPSITALNSTSSLLSRKCLILTRNLSKKSMKVNEIAAIHVPVMKHEVLNLWLPARHNTESEDQTIHLIDGTLGLGGHSLAAINFRSNVRILGIDRDPYAVKMARKRFESEFSVVSDAEMSSELNENHFKLMSDSLFFHHGSYADISSRLLDQNSFPSKVDGILLDLGMNSYQIENPNRGFTFRKTGPLDMRFNAKFGNNNGSAVKARDVVNNYSAVELSSIFQRYADEPHAEVIAKAIVQWRKEKELERSKTDNKGIQSTLELRYIIEEAVFRHNAEDIMEDSQNPQEGQGAPCHLTKKANKLQRYRKIWRHNQAGALSTQKKRKKLIPLYEKQKVHNADSVMRCFQALRIETNDELQHLQSFIQSHAIRDVLNVGGRLVTIAFHPGEDIIVRKGMEQLVQSGEFRLLTPEDEGLRPTEDEVRENSKSRTARLRAVEKVK
ncbi:hypothetical protein HJC23_011789 [Cyclotella cryptica]|uniref:Uncharacterized protein n=1 Tax=Cyclotella cryptica TaxID=29204 RepID=A0ABD3PJU5_9STRA